ncbi:hypothetical protein [Pannonibacter sp. SL95]|uniref:hypothetical protein n=1 Tax=Pannonibacter sp. SL95 TaxID=2995153 RepID=UPI002274DECB|nr:hypothetical protein [Pannonibacter sp. SL95]MCY1705073.1 hypothetical protein [Pannonibacter sp. SL95]
MNWDQIEIKWMAMARRIRPDRTTLVIEFEQVPAQTHGKLAADRSPAQMTGSPLPSASRQVQVRPE